LALADAFNPALGDASVRIVLQLTEATLRALKKLDRVGLHSSHRRTYASLHKHLSLMESCLYLFRGHRTYLKEETR
jgi:hypothetical protein